MRGMAIAFLVILLPAAMGLSITESIEYMDAGRALVRLEILEISNDSLLLAWSLPEIEEVTLEGNASLSMIGEEDAVMMLIERIGGSRLDISLAASIPLISGEGLSYPIPSLSGAPEVSLSVLLPNGWTSQECSPPCSRTLDHETGRIRLQWTATAISPIVTPVIPGLGEDGLRDVMFRMALRGYAPYVLAAIPVALILLCIRFRGAEPGRSLETLLFRGRRGGDGTHLEEENEPTPDRH